MADLHQESHMCLENHASLQMRNYFFQGESSLQPTVFQNMGLSSDGPAITKGCLWWICVSLGAWGGENWPLIFFPWCNFHLFPIHFLAHPSSLVSCEHKRLKIGSVCLSVCLSCLKQTGRQADRQSGSQAGREGAPISQQIIAHS